MSTAQQLGNGVTVEDLERDPYPIYEQLREHEPVSWVESVGLWLVTRFDDVKTVDLNPEIFTAETDPSTLNRTFGKNMLGSEGPYHDRIRSIIEPAFKTRAVRELYAEQIIRPLANDLIDTFADRGEVELMAAFAEPLSVQTLGRVLGLAEVEPDTLRRWFGELALGAANFEGNPDKQEVADAASAEVDATVGPILDRLADEPDDSTLSQILHTEVDGERLTRGEILANLKVMIVGGMQEPADAIGISLWALLSHPEQAEEVRADPELISQAVEEALRWHSPVGTSTRQTTRDAELAGVALEKGSLVAAVVASANRDPRHWNDPDRFDIHRREGAHLAFATGGHHCVGAYLSRFELRIAFQELFRRLPDLCLNGDDPVELEGWEFRRPLRLNVAWSA